MVYILLAPGFEEAEALVPADLLRRAGIETALTALEGNTVTGSHGITVQADLRLAQAELDKAEMVVLPGGGVGVKNLGASAEVETFVRGAYGKQIPVAAICAAPTLLGRWGMLQGRAAVCYPGMEDQLTGAEVRREEPAVNAGPVLTGRAAGSAFTFGLMLVERLAGAEKAREVQDAVCYF